MEKIIRDRIEKIEKDIVPEGYKKTSIGIIPQDWQVKKLGEMGEFIGGGTPSTKKSNYWNGDIPWISSSDLVENSIKKININKYITKQAIESSSTKLVPENSLLIVSRVGIGKLAINDKILCTSQDFLNLIKCKGNVFFLAELIKQFIEKIHALSRGTTIKGVSKNDLKNIKYPFPPLEEQEKIADILTLWDEYIENMDNLIEKKEELKKGLMQKLLTGEKRLPGHTQPWKKVKLGDVAEIVSGGTPLRKYKEYYNGDILWATIKDITDNNKYIYTTNEKITQLGFKNSKLKKYKKDTILYAIYASIGECVIIKNELCSNQAILNIAPENKKLNVEFLYYVLTKKKKKIKLQGQTGTQSNLNLKMVKDFIINLPPLDEQRAISDILSKADEEIELLKELRDKKLEEKKGLMQLLLTGIIRV